MALIILTIQDLPNGSVSVQLTDEPKCTEDQKEFTPAQHIGAAALNTIDKMVRDPLYVNPNSKKLKLVGADELPL